MLQQHHHASTCLTSAFRHCSEIVDTGFSFAFQPVVDTRTDEINGQEALVRGLSGESAATVLAAISPDHQYNFDQACRMRAIRDAARQGITDDLHLNCSKISPDNLALSITATLESAMEHGIDPARIVLEFGNLELLGNPRQLDKARDMAHAEGLRVLADNVGCGEVGLKRLAVFQPDFAKLDRSLIRSIDSSPRRQAIVHGIVATCRSLGIEMIATGIERREEADWLQTAGVHLMQGFYYAHPSRKPTERLGQTRSVAPSCQ